MAPASQKLKKKREGHIFPNLLDGIKGYHSPFQIDANFGFTSGIAEMLLQSQDGSIFVLPALPDQWKNGSVKGFLARGGFKVNISWSNGKASKVKIYSKLGGNCRIRYYWPLRPSGSWELKDATGANPNLFYKVPDIKSPLISEKAELHPLKVWKTYLYDFTTKAGKSYVLLSK